MNYIYMDPEGRWEAVRGHHASHGNDYKMLSMRDERVRVDATTVFAPVEATAALWVAAGVELFDADALIAGGVH